MNTFFDRLKDERKKTGLNQLEFGARCGVAKLSQVNYESGKRKPDIEYLEKLHKLGCDAAYIVTGKRSLNNEKILNECIFRLETKLVELEVELDSELKTKIIVLLYGEAAERNGVVEDLSVERILKLVA